LVRHINCIYGSIPKNWIPAIEHYKYSCVLLISKENPAMAMIKNKITDASIILVMFNCRDPILRDASVNAIDVPDQRKAVRSAISSPNNILSKK